jgi:hypothetical protein
VLLHIRFRAMLMLGKCSTNGLHSQSYNSLLSSCCVIRKLAGPSGKHHTPYFLLRSVSMPAEKEDPLFTSYFRNWRNVPISKCLDSF